MIGQIAGQFMAAASQRQNDFTACYFVLARRFRSAAAASEMGDCRHTAIGCHFRHHVSPMQGFVFADARRATRVMSPCMTIIANKSRIAANKMGAEDVGGSMKFARRRRPAHQVAPISAMIRHLPRQYAHISRELC